MGTRTQESQDYPSQTEKETQAEDGKSRTEGGKSSGGEKVFDGRKTSGGGRNATEESGQTKTKMRTKMEQKVAFIGSWMDDA